MDKDIDLLSKVIEYNKNRYIDFKNGIVSDKNIEYERILSARYMKISRIKKRFYYLLPFYKYIWFCTFTFDDYYINRTSRTKRDLIKKCINSYDFQYILNIDYGKTTEREHYHCIIATNTDIDLNNYFQESYPCFCSALLCNTSKEDITRLTKYINKLTNHCVKSTCKRQRILYNFKGFDSLCPTCKDSTIMFHLYRDYYLNNVSLT